MISEDVGSVKIAVTEINAPGEGIPSQRWQRTGKEIRPAVQVRDLTEVKRGAAQVPHAFYLE